MRVEEAIDLFQKHQVAMERSENTIHSYRNDLQHFKNYLMDTHNAVPYVEEVTEQDIEDYLYHLKVDLNYKSSSRKRKQVVIKSFFKFCYKKKLCTINIAEDVSIIKPEQKERIYLTDDEVQIFVQEIDHLLIKLVIQTLYYTGLRISECCNLTLSDVDLDKGFIKVVQGKGNKDRVIPIHGKLNDLLQDYLVNRRPQRGEAFFCTYQSGGVTPVYVNRIIQQTRKKLGWKKEITAHTFRHSFASNLVKRKVNVVQIQKLLGHSNLVTTSIYTHSQYDDLEEAVNSL